MLQEGYHQSFAEFFALVKQQNDERERAGPESALWNQTLLENEYDKLDKLKDFLTLAENSLRQGEMEMNNVHMSRCYVRSGFNNDHIGSY